MARATFRTTAGAFGLGLCLLFGGCNGGDDAPELSKSEETDEIPNVPVPPADGPKLGAIADIVPVLDRPKKDGKQVGYLHAGALVARAEEPYKKGDGCPGGWYPVRPRGFVCAGDTATTDLAHPTLAAMKLGPKLDQPLPYTYARVRKDTLLFERDPDKDDTVREVGKLARRTILAIVGSWNAKGPEGELRLGLTTNGRFVSAADLEPADASSFKGVELDGKTDLPLAFVVKRGIRAWNVEKGDAEKLGRLSYHEILPLTGRFRTSGPLKYWAVSDGRYVRHRDVTAIRKRNVWPDFATGDQKWIDVSVVTGTLVLYEGRKPVFATLCSVGRDRLGDPKTTASTAMGTFEIVGKHVTAAKLDPKTTSDYIAVHDLPWAMELSSGQLLHAALWHDRFGIEHGPGSVQLSPADAARVWSWVEPPMPDGWHGTTQPPEKKTMVVVRK